MALQIDNGEFTRISNEVLEHLVKVGLLGSELALILFVIRKTWGWHKKEDIISLTQFEKGLGVSRHTVINTVKNLVSKKMLVKRSAHTKETTKENKKSFSLKEKYQEVLRNKSSIGTINH